MRNPLRWLAEKAAVKDRDREALTEAKAERETSRETSAHDEALAREAETMAKRLRSHREANHFAERMGRAFHERGLS